MTLSSSRRAVCVAVLGGGLMLSPKDAHADVAASRVHLTYDVPAGCTTRKQFLSALQSRIQESWVDAADPRSFDVRVTRLADGTFSGRLEVHQPDRASRAREIQDRSCAAVTTSLAIFVAIALDPESEPAPPSEGRPREPERERATPSTHELPPREERPPPRAPISLPVTPVSKMPMRWTIRAGYAISYLRAPESSWGGRVHAELGRGDERERLAVSLRGSWGWSDFSLSPAGVGEARFRLRTARVEGCLRHALAPTFVAGGCGGLDVGTLAASTPDLPQFAKESTPWTAAVAALRASWSPFAPWFGLELTWTVLVPFERPSFSVAEPYRFVYRAPAALLEASAGLVVFARFR